ncbi:hypothetical protein [Acidiphilium angustum]|uniref:hypothetical protein n=1 Tax=Acidiphilium angustum TaxID=523 RepID=UPI000493E74E|nr:hypothetical protein [Acidiphilium angustum]
MCIARLVRHLNEDLWAPSTESCPQPYELVEPTRAVVIDHFGSADGRTWCRVYLDGSALDHTGATFDRAPNAARERRELLAA